MSFRKPRRTYKYLISPGPYTCPSLSADMVMANAEILFQITSSVIKQRPSPGAKVPDKIRSRLLLNNSVLQCLSSSISPRYLVSLDPLGKFGLLSVPSV